ncbi:phenylacetate--CoA ligase family protein [Streptomyces sp. NPDC088354]|uniref:phenylacetate--CoA ligase family protein n=1 Tax=unclassified Streptomyces TaxID=2593676 RepID=UPI0029A79908|nr:AMP-binding protein [Streptomyces sp. MI02-7b]MDX3074178.1 hypothetical protein [Streptomyces sp. MI02-7b]
MSSAAPTPTPAPTTQDPRIAEGFRRQRAHRAALPAGPADRRAANAAAAEALAAGLRTANPGYARLWDSHTGEGPPVLDKTFLAGHFDAFADGLPVTAASAAAFAAAPFRLGSRYDDDHLVFTSSGSSGRPLPVVYTVEDFGRTVEAFLHRAVRAERPDARSLLYVGLLDRHNGGNAWMYYLGGALETVLADVFAEPEQLLKTVDDVRPDVLLTRPHQLHALGELASSAGTALPGTHLLSVGEALQPEQRAGIARHWGRPPHNSYSTVETGPLGYQEDPCDDSLSLYDDLHHVELLDTAGTPVTAPGVPGRVVVTTLYRRTLPLVRYRIGDVAAWADDTRTRLTFPLGRDTQTLEIRTRTGRARMPELPLWTLAVEGLRQYQVVQIAPDRLLVRCEPAEGARWTVLERRVRDRVTELVSGEAGLRDVRVGCERVDALLPDRASGKIKRVVPLSAPAQDNH